MEKNITESLTMELIRNNLNKLHYCLFLIECKMHYLFNKINPAILLYRIPLIKNRLKKSGIDDPVDWNDNFWLDKKSGFGLRFIGGWLIGIVFLLLLSLGMIGIQLVNSGNFEFDVYFFWFFGIISFVLCYFLVFKNDQYLRYFTKYEKWTVKDKRINVLISVVIIVGVLALFFLSLLYPF